MVVVAAACWKKVGCDMVGAVFRRGGLLAVENAGKRRGRGSEVAVANAGLSWKLGSCLAAFAFVDAALVVRVGGVEWSSGRRGV